MFAMLQGPWPRRASDGTDLAALEADVAAGRAQGSVLADATSRLVAEVLAVQAEAGLELLTDGQVRWPDMADTVRRLILERRLDSQRPLLAAWTAAAAVAPADRTVAQAVPGPYSLGHAIVAHALAEAEAAGEAPPSPADQAAARFDVTLSVADALAGEVEALAGAGCAMLVVEEPATIRIGSDASERMLFADASRRLLARSPGVHAMLAITGGSAHEADAATIFRAPWQSLLVDLVAGPDNWYLVRSTPGDRGVVCGVLTVTQDGRIPDQAPEMVWASHFAAASNGRGIARVGLTNATRLADRTPEAAREAVAQLAVAARYASMPVADAVAAGLDERIIRDARPVPSPENRASRRRKARQAGEARGARGAGLEDG